MREQVTSDGWQVTGEKALGVVGRPAFRECCGQSTNCVDSRPTVNATRRNYVCRKCGKRWVTVEMAVDTKSPRTRVVDRQIIGVSRLNGEQRASLAAVFAAFRDEDFQQGKLKGEGI